MERPSLETERLLVRRFEPADWLDLYEYIGTPEVRKYEPDYPPGEDGAKQMASFFAQCDEFWAVTQKPKGKVIGHIHLGLRDPKEFENWNLGFVFNPRYYNRGYATEASLRVLRYGFEELGIRRVESGCNPNNTGSWRVLEKCGLRREAHHLRNRFMKRDADGKPLWSDDYIYAVLREEWLEQHR